MNRKILRFAAAAAILLAWASLTLLLVLVGMLMSLDEEWRGWGDLVLNPYVVVPYVGVTIVAALAVWRVALRRSHD
jgi:fumarate reductase subunit C